MQVFTVGAFVADCRRNISSAMSAGCVMILLCLSRRLSRGELSECWNIALFPYLGLVFMSF